MLCDIESELEDVCNCYDRALEIAKEFLPDDKELYNILIAGRDHNRWICSLIEQRESAAVNKEDDSK